MDKVDSSLPLVSNYGNQAKIEIGYTTGSTSPDVVLNIDVGYTTLEIRLSTEDAETLAASILKTARRNEPPPKKPTLITWTGRKSGKTAAMKEAKDKYCFGCGELKDQCSCSEGNEVA